jgi:hypothetical protein
MLAVHSECERPPARARPDHFDVRACNARGIVAGAYNVCSARACRQREARLFRPLLLCRAPQQPRFWTALAGDTASRGRGSLRPLR